MTITIVGVGLIGGSIAMKLKSKDPQTFVYGVDFNTTHLQQAKELGIIDEYSQLEHAVLNSELIIVAVPVNAAAKIVASILTLITEKQTVIDVGSTKVSIVESVKNHQKRDRFVAFHPMWGTENSGPQSATAQSFSGRSAVICDRENSAQDALLTTEKLAQVLDLHLLYMSATEHDLHAAYISHISHITSYALANTVLEKEKEQETIFQLASSGFSSTVRLAKSHSEMWVPIFSQNRENILDVLGEHIVQLEKFRTALKENNTEALQQLISSANKIRTVLEEKKPISN